MGDANARRKPSFGSGKAMSRFGEDCDEPEVIEQLRIWATELAEMAEQMECRTVQHEMAE
jgi:hypothetical protein